MKIIKFIIVLLLFVSSFALAQDIKLAKSVFSNGGSPAADNTYKLNGTICQSFIGITQDNQNKNYVGFWYNPKQSPDPVEQETAPSDFILSQNYPNPFYIGTTIEFFSEKPEYVEISIYNLIGEKIMDIFKGYSMEGMNKIEFRNQGLESGIYQYRLCSKNETISRLMVILE
jgi:hypothetical protein